MKILAENKKLADKIFECNENCLYWADDSRITREDLNKFMYDEHNNLITLPYDDFYIQDLDVEIVFTVNLESGTVKSNGCEKDGICNFEESGITDDMEANEIKAHLIESRPENIVRVDFCNFILAKEGFMDFFGYDPVTELTGLKISEKAYYSIEKDATVAVIIVGNQRLGAFDIEAGEMV